MDPCNISTNGTLGLRDKVVAVLLLKICNPPRRKNGTIRLYRRAVEMSRRVAPNEQRARELSGAIKACIRAPLQAHAILMKYDAMLWRWIQKMEGTQKTKREPELRLIAASTKLLLLSQGSRPPSSGDSSNSSKG